MITRVYYTIEDLYTEYLANGFNKLFIQWLGTYQDTAETIKLYEDIEDNFYDDYILYIDISHPHMRLLKNLMSLTYLQILTIRVKLSDK